MILRSASRLSSSNDRGSYILAYTLNMTFNVLEIIGSLSVYTVSRSRDSVAILGEPFLKYLRELTFTVHKDSIKGY